MRILVGLFVIFVFGLGCEPEITFSNHLGDRFDTFITPPPRPLIRPHYMAQEALSSSIVRGHCMAYSELQTDPESKGLSRRSTMTIASIDISRIETPAARTAFWLNTYNLAVMVRLSGRLLNNPEASVSDGGFELLRTPAIAVGDTTLAPDWIHHGILRGDFSHVALAGIDAEITDLLRARHEELSDVVDPRWHFALACGAIGCPTLAKTPYRGETLDAQLDAAVEHFLDDPERGASENGVSAIFHWYAPDFVADGGPQGFLTRYRPENSFAVGESLFWDWRTPIFRPGDPRCADDQEGESGEVTTDPDPMGPIRECDDGQVRPCGPTASIGICKPGAQSCTEGLWGDCIGAVEALNTELCNGLDDDCDGQIDNETVLNNDPTPCPTQGVCLLGTPACTAGTWVCELPVSYEPNEVSCDGLDNDCNGIVDDGQLVPPIELPSCAAPGVCSGIEAQCTDGEWACTYPDSFESETEQSCDGLDNDCDANIDEAIDGCECTPGSPNRPCGTAVGECEGGFQRCTLGAWGPCLSDGDQPVAGPGPELCDGLDNNCNGIVDDGVLNACAECGETPPEVCDEAREDEDCDGRSNEGVANACGGCGQAPAEVCDGFDNDCDGAIDEGVTNDCGGCGQQGAEECNGLDDDCDGAVDEDLSAPSDINCPSLGVCSRNTDPGCLGAEGFGCVFPRLYEAEESSCDFRDNDCDGQVDEGLLNRCDFCGPVPIELCNHVDDDCDTHEDEGCPIDPNSQNNRD